MILLSPFESGLLQEIGTCLFGNDINRPVISISSAIVNAQDGRRYKSIAIDGQIIFSWCPNETDLRHYDGITNFVKQVKLSYQAKYWKNNLDLVVSMGLHNIRYK